MKISTYFEGIGLGSDAIASKIVELSKKIRELNAELEAERTKNKQLHKSLKDIEFKLLKEKNSKASENDGNKSQDEEEDVEKKLTRENKDLKEKLNQANAKMLEFKSQSEIIKLELKKTTLALEKEVGDNVDVKAILSGQSNWRGRQQQIRTLKNKVFLKNF